MPCTLNSLLHTLTPSSTTVSLQKLPILYLMFLFVTLCGVIAGAEGWSEIHDYAKGHHEWFQKQGFLSDGLPVDDTIARIISKIAPEQFRQCFIDWMQAVHKLTQGEVIAIDGKTLRSSYAPEDRKSTIHMVNAFACANKVVLGAAEDRGKIE